MSFSGGCSSCGARDAEGTVGVLPALVTEGVSIASHLVDIGSNPRAGGADPCCPPGFNPPAPWPTNANLGGAPPDYRTKGSPMTDPSPSGTGRKKDDFCDCIPFQGPRGKWWMVGVVSDRGEVSTGLPPDRAQWPHAVWVQVDPQTRSAIAVPGVGTVAVQTTGGSPTQPSGGAPELPATAGPVSATVGWVIGLGVIGALFVASRKAPRRGSRGTPARW